MQPIIDNNIEKLLKQKSFYQLSQIEKDDVLKVLSVEEYEKIYNLINGLKLINQKHKKELTLSSINKIKLNQFFKEKYKSNLLNSFKIPVIKISFPYFKPVFIAASLLIIAIIINLRNNDEEYELTIEEFNKYTTFPDETQHQLLEVDETTAILMNI